jgi:phosphoribosylformimino-5-aminoimidazole carboxamide ribotide isomerase
VDLDGAAAGAVKNIESVKKIIDTVGVGIEFGGGVRSMATISKLLGLGVQRVILGTKAASDKEFLKKAVKKFGKKIIVSIDAKDGLVQTRGWKSQSKKTTLAFAQELKAMGFKQLIYTDISKDGTLTGPDIAGVKALLKKTQLDVIASGGVSGLGDLVKLAKLQKAGLSGVIIGKALYEGKFTLGQAQKIA